jgi:hypothetical protein
MEISNISRIGVGFRNGIVVMTILALSACASSTKHHRESAPAPNYPGPVGNSLNSTKPGEVYGPVQTETGPIPAPAGPAEMVANPDQVVLVFGRGLTQGYAYVGVLRALRELKVPVHAIYATEIGALAAALSFTEPNLNRMDWALLHFSEKNLAGPSSKFSFHLAAADSDLDAKLREVFGDRRIEPLAEKLHIELQDAKSGETIEARSGELWRAVRGALAGANQFSPIDFEGRSVRASARKLSEAYRLARQSEKYPIIVVSAGEPPPELFHKLIENQHATLLYVPLPGIDDLDLKKRNQAVFLGKSTVHKAATEILGLVGRKPE